MQGKTRPVQPGALRLVSEQKGKIRAVREPTSRIGPEPAFTLCGDALAALTHYPALRESVGQRFWRMVDKSGGDGACWPWQGTRKRGGYGSFKVASYVTSAAHRLAYALAHGEAPGELHVCHACDNPPCCNPDHLWLGTNADNTADKMAKGRQKGGDMKGEKNHNSKISAAQVQEIRARILAGETNVAIARDYPISHQLVSRIRRGRAWGQPAMQDQYASLKRPPPPVSVR